MKFTEAIAMGRNLITFTPLNYLHDNCGCLIGMAAAANGETNLDELQGDSMRLYVSIWLEKNYPWIVERRSVPSPCNGSCHYSVGAGYVFPNVHSAINHMAHHVSSRDWTLEQVLDWLRSIEPQEETNVEVKHETERSYAVR